MKGFTILESLIYIGLIVIIMPLVTAVIYFTVNHRVAASEISLITQEGERLIRVITLAARNANGLNNLLIGDASSTLSLEMVDLAKNPTIFKLEGGILTIKEGGAVAVDLNSDQVLVTNAVFTNVARPGTVGSVKIELSLAAGLFNKDFYATASLR